jgi:hypothetical protein
VAGVLMAVVILALYRKLNEKAKKELTALAWTNLRGAFPPVLLRADCFVRAIVKKNNYGWKK